MQAGQRIVERIEVANDTRLPKLWLEVEELSNLPQHESKHVVTLGGNNRRSWRVEGRDLDDSPLAPDWRECELRMPPVRQQNETNGA